MKKPSKTRAQHAHFVIRTLVFGIGHCLLDTFKWKLELQFKLVKNRMCQEPIRFKNFVNSYE